jgi:hypothetical protein
MQVLEIFLKYYVSIVLGVEVILKCQMPENLQLELRLDFIFSAQMLNC